MKKVESRIITCVILIICLLLAACSWCGNTLISEQFSPDGRKKVVVFERDGGATTGFSTQVSVMRKRKSLSNRDTGNIIVMDDRLAEGTDYSIRWVDDDTLEVFIADGVKTFTKKEKFGGVTIRYVER